MSKCRLIPLSEKQAMKEFAFRCEACGNVLPESIRHKHISKKNKVICIKCLKGEEFYIPKTIEKEYVKEWKESRNRCGRCNRKLPKSLRHRRIARNNFILICIMCSNELRKLGTIF